MNHLKALIPKLISPQQTGFIPSRSIHDNIVVAQEMMHSMRRMQGKVGYIIIKVDLSKAYDKICWSFVAKILKEVELPQNMMDVIMSCISSVKTNVLWNGQRSDMFSFHRGLRQGDPLLPYLFVLFMDKLSHIFSKWALETYEDG